MAYIKSTAHVSSFKSWLRMSILSMAMATITTFSTNIIDIVRAPARVHFLSYSCNYRGIARPGVQASHTHCLPMLS